MKERRFLKTLYRPAPTSDYSFYVELNSGKQLVSERNSWRSLIKYSGLAFETERKYWSQELNTGLSQELNTGYLRS